MWFKVASVILLFSGTILVVAVLLFLNLGTPSHENKYINKSEYQAVFVNVTGTNGGQVYFGHVTDMSEDFVRLTNVFYIQNQNTNANANNTQNAYNLVKLGCELHGPQDEMVINRDQVFFWENLKANGQVTQKIAEYYKNNGTTQKCSDNNSNSSTQQGDSPQSNNGADTSKNKESENTDKNKAADNSATTPKQ